MSKNVFIVLTHSYSPSRSEPGKWEVSENCEFVSILKNRHFDRASLILDIRKERIVKSRETDGTYQQFLSYVTENYPDHMSELNSKYFADTPVGETVTSEIDSE